MPLLDERVLILAPNARDAELTQQTLEGRDLTCVICPDLKVFLRMMEEGAGLGLLAEESTGTGKGLATAYGLIKQHGGDLCAKSAPGQGTTFQIYLPRFTGTHKAERRPASKPHPAEGGAETILVTEDEDIVRTISVRALEKRGYRVIQAHDARKALKLSKSHPGPIDLLLTDVVMPGMNGQELVAALKLTRPDTRILYMSGYSREMVARHGVMESGAGFIEKAFSAEKLCRTVRAILDQPATTSKRKTSHSGG